MIAMAKRPVFVPQFEGPDFVRKLEVEFEWFPGFSLKQKQRSIRSLHSTAAKEHNLSPLLEISSKSPSQTGIDLSAFKLIFESSELEHPTSVEAAFQGSKVFENDGPFSDLYAQPAHVARKDPRLKESGELIAFRFGEIDWPLVPNTAFYDWLYLLALSQQTDRTVTLLEFEGFTDIEFNPKRSINCQAGSAALYVALTKRGLLTAALETPKRFLEVVSS